MSRRRLASSLASRLGLVPLLERFGSRPGLAVLVYHRILDPSDHAYDRGVIEATPDEFDAQMRMLRARVAVVDPEELPELVAQPSKIRRFRVAITFDDGYLDNYTIAFPILKSHGLRATFFLATGYVGSRHLSWWDRIAYVVRHSDRSELRLHYPRPLVVKVDRDAPDEAVRTVLREYKRAKGVDFDRFAAGLEEACGVPMPTEAAERQFLAWDEAVEMARAGMGIGSHTHTHSLLANLSAEEQSEECRRSRTLLGEHRLSADTIAYPVGGPGTFSATTKSCAKEAGYRCAFSNYGGLNVPGRVDPWDVRRIGMDREENADQLRLRLALTSMARRQPW